MQNGNWNDLRYVLALKRGRSLAGAARLLGVDDTTVSRRLAALQSDMESLLYERHADGVLRLTAGGEAVARHVEAMEHQVDLMGETVERKGQACTGVVRLTSVPIVINRLLTPQAGTLLEAHPDLEIELVPDSRDLSLTRREADLALRLARPTTGGTAVKARRIGYLDYGVYASRTLLDHEAGVLPWITYEDPMAHMPQAQWIAKAARGHAGAVAGLRVHDAETALEAAIAGLGRTVLPDTIAGKDRRLRRLAIGDARAPPSREIWLLAHADQLELRRVRAVIAWIEAATGHLGGDGV